MSFTIQIITIGKNNQFDTDIDRFISLAKPYAKISVLQLKPDNSKAPIEQVRQREAVLVGRRLGTGGTAVALSGEGKFFSSPQFAQWLEKRRTEARMVSFIIGGAYGLTDELKKSCFATMSLSPLTYSHRLALLVLCEQLYRGLTIIHNHPYHKE